MFLNSNLSVSTDDNVSVFVQDELLVKRQRQPPLHTYTIVYRDYTNFSHCITTQTQLLPASTENAITYFHVPAKCDFPADETSMTHYIHEIARDHCDLGISSQTNLGRAYPSIIH